MNGVLYDVNVVYVIFIENSLESNWDKYIKYWFCIIVIVYFYVF